MPKTSIDCFVFSFYLGFMRHKFSVFVWGLSATNFKVVYKNLLCSNSVVFWVPRLRSSIAQEY